MPVRPGRSPSGDGPRHDAPVSTDGSVAGHRRLGAGFVAAQFLLLALVVLLPGGSAWTLPPWAAAAAVALMGLGLALMAVAALGLGRGLTAMPLPNEHAQLRTGGLYGWVRHPIYSGLLLFAVADTARSGSWLTVAACAALIALMTAKARWEEDRLAERFPAYPVYASRTGRFLPRPGRRPADGAR